MITSKTGEVVPDGTLPAVKSIVPNVYPEPPLEIEFQDNSVLIELCGVRDQNIIFLEDKLGIQITRRGNKLFFSGNFDDQKKAANILKNIYFYLIIICNKSFCYFIFSYSRLK